MKKMLVIDGNSILNRAFYGIRLLTNRDGLYTNAVYGMITILSRHLETLSPEYCAVAFDLKAPTFRHSLYNGYKANRKGMPEELAVQLPYAKECMKEMGLSVITCEGYEADDILGTLAHSMGDEETHVYLLTGDRDSLQLISEHVSVLLVKTKETILFDTQEFIAQYGVSPSEFVDVKALMGDSSDNIPGVAGIGEKTALKLIADYHNIENLYTALRDAALSEGIKKKLEAGEQMAHLSKELAQICCCAPISTDKEAYRYTGPHATALKRLFIQLEFSALIKKMGLDQVEDEISGSGEIFVTDENKEEMSPTFASVDSLDELNEEVLYLSFEDSFLSMLCGQNGYRERIENIPAKELQAFLQEKKIVCYDSKNLYKKFRNYGIKLPICFFDSMLAAYVLDSNRSKYTIEELYLRYCKEPMPSNMDEITAVHRLYQPLNLEIEQGGFERLLHEIELPLAYVLADMELEGFQIDPIGIGRYGEALNEAAQILQMRIYSYAGEEFNIGSPKQLGEILFEKMGLPKAKKTKTGYSTDAETLQKLITKHPIIEDILEYRQLTKLKSTYAEGLVKAADSFGRVHSILNQTGTATGRLSSSEPNLQNIPIKTELGREFRKFFIPKKENYVLIDADYSQIELRLLAHIANDEAMIEAFLSQEDIHTMTAAKVFNVPPDTVTADLRKKAKAVNFGILYGIGEYSLSEDLGISRSQAKEYIDSYFAKFPKIKEYLSRVQDEAKRDGFVTTFFGRRRYIPELASSNKNVQHFGQRVAMNSPIQGTAADIMKIAMIRIDRFLKERSLDAALIMQVHDELIIESHASCADEVKALLIEAMEGAASFSVPLSVEANIGRTWFDAK